MSYEDVNPFTPQKFQHFNPFFIVVLTPLIVGFFIYLNKKGKEPSAPRKIGIGMLITSVAFTILIIGWMVRSHGNWELPGGCDWSVVDGGSFMGVMADPVCLLFAFRSVYVLRIETAGTSHQDLKFCRHRPGELFFNDLEPRA
jgi:hypothetical protein